MSATQYGTYTCRPGETFDTIALVIYGDEDYATNLMQANRQYGERMIFRGGEILSVPDAAGETTTKQPKWKNDAQDQDLLQAQAYYEGAQTFAEIANSAKASALNSARAAERSAKQAAALLSEIKQLLEK